MMYVNTTAEVKAETDYCVTSANAAKVVQSLPEDTEILFGPDMFLGAHEQRLRKKDAYLNGRVPCSRRHRSLGHIPHAHEAPRRRASRAS